MIEKDRLIAACRQTATPEVVAHIQRYGDHIVRAYNELGDSPSEPTAEKSAPDEPAPAEPVPSEPTRPSEPTAEKPTAKQAKGGK